MSLVVDSPQPPQPHAFVVERVVVVFDDGDNLADRRLFRSENMCRMNCASRLPINNLYKQQDGSAKVMRGRSKT